jgi:formylglycine-generating enzyme required for sulfatase activity/tRNA A-37 threonylcarbamoyl transferase component Bud32
LPPGTPEVEEVAQPPRSATDHVVNDQAVPFGTVEPPGDPEATRYRSAASPVDPEATRYTPATSVAPAAGQAPGYEILGVLGRGGMGVVYKARHLTLNRIVALKMVLAGGHAGSEERVRFLAEAEAVAALQHPNIVQVFDFGQHGDLPYMALEYVNGGGLNVRLRDGLPPPLEAAWLVEQLARGMAAAHARGIVHRDLKPHNVLLMAPEGSEAAQCALKLCTPKVSDFGLAKKVEGGSGLTQTGAVMGTPSYMAPEQAEGRKDVGPPADVYALGAILYECLTGRPPFRGSTPMDTVRQVVADEPAPVRRLQPRCPRDLETIAHKCLQKDPARRYAGAALLAEDLKRFQEGEPILARPTGPLERVVKWVRRRPVIAALLALVVVLTAAGLAGVAWEYGEAVRERDAAREANRRRLEAQVRQLGSAVPQAVPAILAAVAEEQERLLPGLRQQWADNSLDQRQRMRAGLALLPVEPEKVRDDLLDWMLQAEDPAEVLLTRDALAAHGNALRERLWARADDAKAAAPERFRALVALAVFDPEGQGWRRHAQAATDMLLSANPLHLGSWVDGLRPVRATLGPPLEEVFRTATAPDRREITATVVADYAADQPDRLANLLVDADDRQFAVLFPKLQHHQTAADLLHAEVRRELKPDWKDAPLPPAWKEPAAEVRQELERAEGLLAERWALCQTLPLDRYSTLADELRSSGYRPIRLRPYRHGETVRVAAVWTRDERDWRLAVGLTAADLRQADTDWRAKGYRPEDVAGYRDGLDLTYAALWARPASSDDEAKLYVGLPEERLQPDGWKPLWDAGFMPRTYHVVCDARRLQHFSGVWGKTANNPLYQNTFGLPEASYMTYGGLDTILCDVSLYAAPPPPDARQRSAVQVVETGITLLGAPDDLDARYTRAQAYYNLGWDEQALADLNLLIEKTTNKSFTGGHLYRAFVRAKLGQEQGARGDLQEFEKRNQDAGLKVLVPAAVAIYLGQETDAIQRLEKAVAAHPTDPQVLFQSAQATAEAHEIVRGRQTDRLRAAAVCGLLLPGLSAHGAFPAGLTVPVAALEPALTARANVHAARAVVLLRQAVEAGYNDFTAIQTNLEFDSLRTDPGFRAILERGHPERLYAAVWHESSAREGTELHGLDPATHRQRCQELAAAGYRPAALTAAVLADGQQPVTASAWHRPVVSEADRAALAKGQARAAAALLRLKREEAVWPLLRRPDPDPTRRSYLVRELAALGIEARVLVERLAAEQDVSARRALVLALGEYTEKDLPASLREPLVRKLLAWYRDDPDPGLHSAIDWLLRHGKEGTEARKLDWGQAKKLREIDDGLRRRDPDKRRRWYVNGQGQTYVCIAGPLEFRMGSPPTESDHYHMEMLHRRRISRNFAIASRSVTVAEFQQFLKERTDVNPPETKIYSPDADGPVHAVPWYMAAQYCNWLSAREGLPEAEWCYPAHAAIKAGMNPFSDYLKRKGYRLPTEAEWEYAARAGAESSRYYGSPEELLSRYAWYDRNARDRTWPVGQKRPNDLGLFDALGNVLNWVQDPYFAYSRDQSVTGINDIEDLSAVDERTFRVLRGGNFRDPARYVRLAYRSGSFLPSYNPVTVGLRPARTLP